MEIAEAVAGIAIWPGARGSASGERVGHASDGRRDRGVSVVDGNGGVLADDSNWQGTAAPKRIRGHGFCLCGMRIGASGDSVWRCGQLAEVVWVERAGFLAARLVGAGALYVQLDTAVAAGITRQR